MRKIIAASTFTLLLAALGVAAAPSAQAAPPGVTAAHALFAAGQIEGKININTASEKQWEMLPGIGPATAKKLVTYRNKKPFDQINHVMRIKGIGRKTYNQIKPFLSLKGETTLRRVK